ncbi:DUF1569 domain-containing protein [Allomuricauda sp. d1]|uniref:DUF1569 domain-containing protein n=1 Tax=Allomuricauda sp. d1 TaxID=3136725 RepID=UPI0031E0A233
MNLSGVNKKTIEEKFLKNEVAGLLSKLQKDSIPDWGNMTAQQMVEHLIWTFDVSFGKIRVECFTPKNKLTVFKKFLFSDHPTKQNFRNPLLVDGLPELQHESLGAAIATLKSTIQRFYSIYNTENSKEEIHPIFGTLNFEEWERAHYKHCFHHLQQFDLFR